MDRIDRLERSWLVYKTKKFLKSLFFFAAALIVGAGAVYFVSATTRGSNTVVVTDPPVASQTTRPVEQPAAVSSQPSAPPTRQAQTNAATINEPQTQPSAAAIEPTQPNAPPQQADPSKPKMSIAPSFDFVSEADRRVAESLIASRARPRQETAPRVENETPAVVAPPSKPSATVSWQRVDGLRALEEAFNRQPSYSKAVDIAETYMRQNDPQNAYEWSLKANELNSNDERSWAVFALSSYKIGRKDRAVNALRAYLDARSSNLLTKLLRQIERDEIGEPL
ncbi:MAG: hypothetical protein LBI57_01585 [Helicobacteraceae bacterium]|jgi:hypothetical protein|nr:hypothetical protein [Helicobacteraceae bacterium]